MTYWPNPINISNCQPYLSQINPNLSIINQLNLLQMMTSYSPLNIQLNNNFLFNSTFQEPKNIKQQSNSIIII